MPENTIESLYKKFLLSEIISIDTRKLPAECIFFALKGPNFDGNTFADEAINQGAQLAVLDSAEYFEKARNKERLFLVEDVLSTLQDLANHHRRELGIPVIGIGGSNGKTSTKELALMVLSKKYRCQATQGNLNNHIGVPLTLLSLKQDTEIAIVELGTNQPGDIKELVEIAEPDFGLITNIGKEHLEGFGSLEGVAREESELFFYLQQHLGLAFVNSDDAWLEQMASKLPRTVSFGVNEEANVSGRLVQAQPAVVLEMDNGFVAESNLPGAFNQYNILAAWALGRHFGVEEYLIAEAIKEYKPTNNRSQWLETGDYRFLLDCYNANPSSMELALQSLSEEQANRVVILGDMLELGSHSASEHKAIIELLKELKFEKVILVGSEFVKAADGFQCFDKAEAAAEWLQSNPVEKGSLFFLKGSRGIAVEKAVAHLLNESGK